MSRGLGIEQRMLLGYLAKMPSEAQLDDRSIKLWWSIRFLLDELSGFDEFEHDRNWYMSQHRRSFKRALRGLEQRGLVESKLDCCNHGGVEKDAVSHYRATESGREYQLNVPPEGEHLTSSGMVWLAQAKELLAR